MRKVNLGERFGKLQVIGVASPSLKHKSVLCKCDCGEFRVVRIKHLLDGHTTSCGCARYSKNYNAEYRSRCVVLGALRTEKVRGNNTSGVPGVSWVKNKHKWKAELCFNGSRNFLGYFERFEEAVQARIQCKAALLREANVKFSENTNKDSVA